MGILKLLCLVFGLLVVAVETRRGRPVRLLTIIQGEVQDGRMIDDTTAVFEAWGKEGVGTEECCKECEAINKDYTAFIFSVASSRCACYSRKDGVQVATKVPNQADRNWISHPISGLCGMEFDYPAAVTFAPAAVTDAPAAVTDAPAAVTDAPQIDDQIMNDASNVTRKAKKISVHKPVADSEPYVLGEDRVFDPSTVSGINVLTNYIAVDNITQCCTKCESISQDASLYVFSRSSSHCACLSPVDGVKPATTDPANLQGWMPQPVAGVCDEGGDDAVNDFMKMDTLDLGSGYEDVSDEPMDAGISLGVEEILLEGWLEQLEKENANLKKKIQMKEKKLLNMQVLEKINEKIREENIENMRRNENLITENNMQAIEIEQLQENLQSSQNKGNALQNKLTVTIKNLKNVTTHAKHLKSQLDTELELKSTYQEEVQLERQLHGITIQQLLDSRNMIKVSMNFTKLLVSHISQLENVTDPVDMRSTIDQMKRKESLYMAENLAYQNEILVLRNLTAKERDQNENLINSMTQQGKLEKLKERMMNILQSSLMEMARAIPNCTTITTEELESQLDAVLEEEDPLKQLISECSIFNETSANLQNLYVQHNTQLKEQLATKMNVINHHIGENRELNDALEVTKQLANIQSQSLKLLASQMDRLLPNGITRVQRNTDGTIESVYLCQCIPEAPKASQLEISAIQWTCPEDKAVNHQLKNTFSHTCSDDSDCSVGASSWPQCEDIHEKAWSSWEYFDCMEVDVGNETILCGNGHRSRSREVRSPFDVAMGEKSWRNEDVSEQCEQCSLSAASRHAVAISPPALETALKAAMDVADKVCLTSEGWVEFGEGCYKRFRSTNSWQSARSYCQSLNAELVSIHSYQENNFVRNMISNDAWIGYNDKRSTGNYEWSDGTPKVYSNWYSGQPSSTSEHATIIDDDGKWWDRGETSDYQFVCKF